ncbi:DUF6049 family protein [Pseudokineococcus sp. 1T1Z-3]|uniref:DUF6049 family protein n=1 Tax=Pseudokineococcus sp. 1T1Z-3 TaxID=3132745 RepID=UPI0030A66935
MAERARRGALTAALVGVPLLLAALAPTPAAALPTGPGAPAAPVLEPASTSAARAAAPDDAPGGVRVRVVDLPAEALAADDDLTVEVLLVNGTEQEVRDLTVELRVQRARLDRDGVAAWAGAPVDAAAGAVVLGRPLLEPLPPRTQERLRLSVPAADLGLPRDPSTWGPRGVAVDVVDAGGTRLDADRGHAVWYPGDPEPDPLRLGVVVPLTGAAPDVGTALVPDAELSRLVDDPAGDQTSPDGGDGTGDDEAGDDGRLGRLLTLAEHPGTTWVLDPLLLDSSEPGDSTDAAPVEAPGSGVGEPPVAGATPPLAPGEVPAGDVPSATATTPAGPEPTGAVLAWRERLLAAAPDHEVLALPRADTDLLSVTGAGTPELWRLGLAQAGRSLERAGVSGRTDVVWPAGGALGTGAAELAAGSGAVGALLDGALLDDPPAGPAAPVAGSDLTALLPDPTLTDLLTTADDPDAGALLPARLLAETAALTREEGERALVLPPRTWDADVEVAGAALDALTGAPWVETTDVSDLLADPDPDADPDEAAGGAGTADVVVLPDEATGTPSPPLDAGVLTSVVEAVRAAGALEAVLRDRAPLSASERSAVAAAALAARTRQGWAAEVEATVADLGVLAGAVSLVQGGTVTVVGAETSVPVTVANRLDQAVDVVVTATSDSPRLRVRGEAATTVGPGSRAQVLVPVEAVAGGDAVLRLELRSPGGVLVGAATEVPVQVRLDVAAWGTAGIAGLGALVLLLGLVRTVRRVRARPPGVRPRSPDQPSAAAAGPEPPASPARPGEPEHPPQPADTATAEERR